MCGIIGAALRADNAALEVFEGLKRLEYRGYDSAGITALNGRIVTVKRGGRVSALEGDVRGLTARVAIGHTRWATHGAATDANAHPHNCGAFSLVHNGIIENFRELKTEFDPSSFLSETDSEVIVKLIDREYERECALRPALRGEINALAAVARVVKRLKGSYALAVVCKDFEGIIAVKYKSPVVVGFSKRGVALCSDIPAMPDFVSSVCVPEDGDIVKLSAASATFYDGELKPVTRVRRPIVGGQLTVGKGKYAHFMLKEIYEAPRTVRDTVEGFFRNVNVKRLAEFVRNADRIIITGCGTAYNAGLAARRYFSERCGVFCQIEIASELKYAPVTVTPATLVLAVTQSGETADTIEAVEKLKSGGARVVAVTNCGYSAITRIAHLVVPVCAGAEVCVAATKSYIGQVAALYLIAAINNDVFGAREKLLSAAACIDRLLADTGAADEALARECAASAAVFFLGRGIDYAVAVEASLKLKEVSYVFSDGYPAGELKHGTLALVDGGTLSVFVICDESLAEKSLSGVSQVASRGGRVAVVTTLKEVAERLGDGATVWLLPECAAELAPYVSAVALQLAAYRTAVLLGRDPDKPRNLAKSVTVE